MGPRPRDPHVQETALLVEGRIVVERLADREAPLLERRQGDRVPLEALRAVVREEVDATGRAVALVRGARLEVGEDDRDVGGGVREEQRVDDRDERLERRLPLARLLARVVGRVRLGHVADGVRPPGAYLCRQGWPAAGRDGAATEALDGAADLGPLVERDAADDVGNRRAGQRLLDRRQLRVHPHEDGDLGGLDPLDEPGPDPRDEAVELRVGGRVPRDRGLGAIPARRRQALRPPVRLDQPVGEVEHAGRRAVVPDKRHHPRARPAGLERGEEVRRRARERVDRLVLVAHDAQVAPIADPQLEEPLLERVCVLVLVDAEPRLPGPHDRRRLAVRFEQVDRLDEQVVEVDPAGPRLRALIAVVDPHEQVGRDRRRAARTVDRRALVVPRPDPVRLRPLDLVRQVLRRREAVVPGQLAGEPAEDRQLGVEQLRRRGAVVARRPEVAELRERVCVERARRDPREPERPEAADHLARRLVGEGHDEDLVGRDDVRREGVRRPAADDPRLACAGACEDRDRAGRGDDGLALLGIEVVEQAVGLESGHPARLAGAAHPGLIGSRSGHGVTHGSVPAASAIGASPHQLWSVRPRNRPWCVARRQLWSVRPRSPPRQRDMRDSGLETTEQPGKPSKKDFVVPQTTRRPGGPARPSWPGVRRRGSPSSRGTGGGTRPPHAPASRGRPSATRSWRGSRRRRSAAGRELPTRRGAPGSGR